MAKCVREAGVIWSCVATRTCWSRMLSCNIAIILSVKISSMHLQYSFERNIVHEVLISAASPYHLHPSRRIATCFRVNVRLLWISHQVMSDEPFCLTSNVDLHAAADVGRRPYQVTYTMSQRFETSIMDDAYQRSDTLASEMNASS